MRSRMTLAAVTLAALLLVALGSYVLKISNPRNLLEQAYLNKRTLELRIPGALHSQVIREVPSSRFMESAELLRAEAIIVRRRNQNPEDAALLELYGISHLLLRDSETAKSALKRVLDISPESSEAKINLASAYFESAEYDNRPIDYRDSLELLGEVLSKDGNNVVALFNRAIVYERSQLFYQSIQDWEHYLNLEHEEGWRTEAQQRLAGLRLLVDAHQRKASSPLLSFDRFAAGASAGNSVDERVESYLDLAIVDWIPRAFSHSKSEQDAEESSRVKAALFYFAMDLAKNHNDFWLEDLLSSTPSVAFGLASSRLASAIKNRSTGHLEAARRDALESMQAFRWNKNQPGYLRAKLELAYSLHRLSDGHACIKEADEVVSDAHTLRYTWLRTQAILEESVCNNMNNRLDRAEYEIQAALNLAQKSRYGDLYLRALAFDATAQWSIRGDSEKSWTADWAGMQNYWAGSSPVLRYFSFLQDVAAANENLGYPQVVYSFRREAQAADAQMNEETRHGLTHLLLGKAARKAGDLNLSRTEFAAAELVFSRLKSGDVGSSYLAYNYIQRAEVEGEDGKVDLGLEMLARSRTQIDHLQNSPLKSEYQLAAGGLELKRGDYAKAEEYFLAAAEAAKSGSRNLPSAGNLSQDEITRSAYLGLTKIKLLQGNPTAALERWEEFLGLTTHSAIPGQAILSRYRLENNKAAATISFALFDDGLGEWLIDEAGVQFHYTKMSPSDLERKTRRFLELCSDPKSDLKSLNVNARQLFGWLFAPWWASLRTAKTVIIEADSYVKEVPMEAMVDEQEHYLGAQFAFVYSPGMERYLKLRKGDINPEMRALIVSPSAGLDPSSKLPSIQSAIQEARAVKAIFRRSILEENKQATWATIKRESTGTAVLHFAGHAAGASGQPELLLAGHEHVAASEFFDAGFQTLFLAVFSACSTGTSGDGPSARNDLVSVLMTTDVPHVVVTRWEIDSDATQDMVRYFYEALRQTSSPTQAMHIASRNMMSQPSTSHPYYWAAFAKFGRN
jgi:CHAT domain-containing protein